MRRLALEIVADAIAHGERVAEPIEFVEPPMKIELADQNAVHDPSLAPYIDRVLEAMGHPDALVTDES